MANSADPDQLASSVCKVRVYLGSAGQGLKGVLLFSYLSKRMYVVVLIRSTSNEYQNIKVSMDSYM